MQSAAASSSAAAAAVRRPALSPPPLPAGYFLATSSGTWGFSTVSDDGSFLWVGDAARSGFTTANAVVSNGGAHGAEERTGSVVLTAGVYYPLRIQFGELGGGATMRVSFLPPGSATWLADGAGHFFYNPSTQGL
jgi:hypothetical protein